MEKTDLDFRHLERPWSFWIEAIFSILRLKKIDQRGLELDIKQQFYTKSTPQNPMSQSVFPDYEVGRSFKLIFKITISVWYVVRDSGQKAFSGELVHIYKMMIRTGQKSS